VALVAGDIATHSEALTFTQRSLAGEPDDDVEAVAELCAKALRGIRRRRAANLFLEPLSLDEDTFLAKQGKMLPQLVYDLTNQMQEYRLDVEALIVGCDDRNAAHIFHIDGTGIKTYQHDINFAAIGIGAEHAKSQFMFSRDPKVINYFRALPVLYTAKRRAEVAPGGGKDSDWLLITRDGWEFVHPSLIAELERAYGEFTAATQVKLAEVETRLVDAISKATAAEAATKAIADQTPAATLDVDIPPDTSQPAL